MNNIFIIGMVFLIGLSGCSFVKKDSKSGVEETALAELTLAQRNILSSIRLHNIIALKKSLGDALPSDLDFTNKSVTPIGLAYRSESAEALELLLEYGFSPFILGDTREQYADDFFIYLLKTLHFANSETFVSLDGLASPAQKLLFDAQSKLLKSIWEKVSKRKDEEARNEILGNQVDLAILEYMFIMESYPNWGWILDEGESLVYREGQGERSWLHLEFLTNLKISSGNGKHIQILYQLELMNQYRFSFQDSSYFRYLYNHPKLSTKWFDVGGTGLFVSVDMLFMLAAIQDKEYFLGKRGTDMGLREFLRSVRVSPSRKSFIYFEKAKSLKSFPMYQLSKEYRDQIFEIVNSYIRNGFHDISVSNGIDNDIDVSEKMNEFFARTDLILDFQCREGESNFGAPECSASTKMNDMDRGAFAPADLPEVE